MRTLLLISLITVLAGCSVTEVSETTNSSEVHDAEDGHEHDGSSPLEVLFYEGESDITEPYHIETSYTMSADGDINDIVFRIYDGDVELVEQSELGALENDMEPSLYEQIERLRQYIVGFNKFPPLDDEGHSDELITISIDMRGLEDSYKNAME